MATALTPSAANMVWRRLPRRSIAAPAQSEKKRLGRIPTAVRTPS